MMSIKLPIIKNMHRRYKDSAYTRVMARIFELSFLIKEATKILNSIDILEDSYIKPHDIKTLCGSGVGIVEAPRGPLIHKVDIEDGIIKNYKIITPTQFNIGSSSKNNPTPAQKAMMGVDKKDAVFIFRTFDVCSVCTTH
jgi:coenzyme F420-reducing hydrogenase alpha subunit